MKLLITGGSGFIGTHLTRYFNGLDLDYINLKRHGEYQGYKRDAKNKSFEFYFNEFSKVEQVFKDQSFDYVVNLATNYNPIESEEYIIEAIDSNYILPSIIIKNCLKYQTPLITFGSYIQELQDSRPKGSFYRESKINTHNLLYNLSSKSNFKFIEIILNDTYGLGDNRKKILELILKSFQGETLKTTQGKQLINLLNVGDVCEGVILILQRLSMKNMKFNQTVGLRDLNYITIRQLAKICEELVGIEAKIEWGALPYRGNEFFSAPNLSPILEEWRPKISLIDGIKSML